MIPTANPAPVATISPSSPEESVVRTFVEVAPTGMRLRFSEEIEYLRMTPNGARKLAERLIEQADKMEPLLRESPPVETKYILPEGALDWAFHPGNKAIAAPYPMPVSPIPQDGNYIAELTEGCIDFFSGVSGPAGNFRITQRSADLVAKMGNLRRELLTWRRAKELVDLRVAEWWRKWTGNNPQDAEICLEMSNGELEAMWSLMHKVVTEVIKNDNHPDHK